MLCKPKTSVVTASQTNTVHVNYTCIHLREKNVDDLACLDPLNIVKDYVAGLLDRPLQLTETSLIAE